MSWQKLDTAPETKRLVIIIGNVMHLRQEYDNQQLWFDFVQCIIDTKEPETITNKSSLSIKQKITRMRNQQYYNIDCSDRVIFHHQPELHQYGLPFREFKHVQKIEYANIRSCKFPAWDLIDGFPITVSVKAVDHCELLEWLNDSIKGRYHRSVRVTFQFLSDYALFLLRFK